ncbi:hemerythrin domain-containing protein [Sphingomonas canadensis]|uniref:Hemerythrin domain-containing protein n=1 Tax=Sphingomonas canadensis TaxID=1219257 RepID=A0ABW3H9W1_9SPHN|nr:hemerythrin domain-containing protein [Sphingomonas canadensis]MCW3837928.1 hemerythrin domain-containing protein [Sphingomonas canadensis]
MESSPIIAKLRCERARVITALDEVERLVSGAYPGSMDEIAPHRWALARDLLLHFAHVEALVLQPMMADRRADVAARAARSSADLRGVYDQYRRHFDRWQGLPAESQWDEYRAAVSLLVRRIRVRLLAEESDLFPLLPVQPGTDRITPLVEPVNYAAEAWKVRSRIYLEMEEAEAIRATA